MYLCHLLLRCPRRRRLCVLKPSPQLLRAPASARAPTEPKPTREWMGCRRAWHAHAAAADGCAKRANAARLAQQLERAALARARVRAGA